MLLVTLKYHIKPIHQPVERIKRRDESADNGFDREFSFVCENDETSSITIGKRKEIESQLVSEYGKEFEITRYPDEVIDFATRPLKFAFERMPAAVVPRFLSEIGLVKS